MKYQMYQRKNTKVGTTGVMYKTQWEKLAVVENKKRGAAIIKKLGRTLLWDYKYEPIET